MKREPLPLYAGRKPCGCAVAYSVGGVPAERTDLRWERFEGEVKFDRCKCEEAAA